MTNHKPTLEKKQLAAHKAQVPSSARRVPSAHMASPAHPGNFHEVTNLSFFKTSWRRVAASTKPVQFKCSNLLDGPQHSKSMVFLNPGRNDKTMVASFLLYCGSLNLWVLTVDDGQSYSIDYLGHFRTKNKHIRTILVGHSGAADGFGVCAPPSGASAPKASKGIPVGLGVAVSKAFLISCGARVAPVAVRCTG